MSALLTIGTAGHIDHGKSALVKALTGIDPDRLKEERERGITIDLGFAHTTVKGVDVAFVDVPGHERFVRNMLAGAAGIDAVMLVVAANASIMPQTREHFEICRLLGLERGIVVLTKSDLVDADTLELVTLEVREWLAGSFLGHARMVAVSARTGEGLDELRDALIDVWKLPWRRPRHGVTRLPIDRVFTVKGFGTVVTGTLASGRAAEGDDLVAMPEGRAVRVRGVQIHGRHTVHLDAPGRVALNLGAVAVADLDRGMTLASPGAFAATRRADVRLELLAGARPLRHGARVRVHQGTSEIPARVVICAIRRASSDAWTPVAIGQAAVEIPPGGQAFARLRLERPAVVTRGDRMVLRAYSPARTIGGALVLDPEPPSTGTRRVTTLARFAQLDITPGAEPNASAIVWLNEARGKGIAAQDLVRRGGTGLDESEQVIRALVGDGHAVMAGARAFASDAVREIETQLTEVLGAFHAERPLETGMSREALRERVARRGCDELFEMTVGRLVARGLVIGAERLALASHRVAVSSDDARAREVIETLLSTAGLTPPDLGALIAAARVPRTVVDAAVRALIRDRRLVRLGDLLFHACALTSLKSDIAGLRSSGPPMQLDVAWFKQRHGLTRKFAIPLLEWLDHERVTRRVGNGRIVL